MEDQTQDLLPDIRHTLVLNAPIGKVWDAVSTSEGIAAWFMPNDFQPIEGHQFEINAGPFGMSPCKVVEVKTQTAWRSNGVRIGRLLANLLIWRARQSSLSSTRVGMPTPLRNSANRIRLFAASWIKAGVELSKLCVLMLRFKCRLH